MGQKETWSIVIKEQVPASQADLKSQEKKTRKRLITALDQYVDSELRGFKRKQVGELIRECVRLDPDPRFEYVVASIKRDIRQRPSDPQTSFIQVMLKRQPRAGIDTQGPPFIGFDSICLPSGGFVDLSGAASAEDRSSMIRDPPRMQPFERYLSKAWVQFKRYFSKAWVQVDHPETRPPIPHADSHHGHRSFPVEDPDVKSGQENLSVDSCVEDSVGLGTSNVHDGGRDVRSPLGNVSSRHDAASFTGIGRAPSLLVIRPNNDQSSTHETNFGQSSPRLDGSYHDHPILGEEGHDVKHSQSDLSDAQHHEETNDPKSLSNDRTTESINLKPVSRISNPLSRGVHHVRNEPEYHYNLTNDLISLSSGTTNRTWNKRIPALQSFVGLQR